MQNFIQHVKTKETRKIKERGKSVEMEEEEDWKECVDLFPAYHSHLLRKLGCTVVGNGF